MIKILLTAAAQKLFDTIFVRHPESESGRMLKTSDGEEIANWLKLEFSNKLPKVI